jgi:hypothetical protein
MSIELERGKINMAKTSAAARAVRKRTRVRTMVLAGAVALTLGCEPL